MTVTEEVGQVVAAAAAKEDFSEGVETIVLAIQQALPALIRAEKESKQQKAEGPGLPESFVDLAVQYLYIGELLHRVTAQTKERATAATLVMAITGGAPLEDFIRRTGVDSRQIPTIPGMPKPVDPECS